MSVVVLVPDGQLEVRNTDTPPPSVTKILVSISLIEVHKADAADDAGWISVFEGDERTFDLVAATAIEDVLGTETFAAGKYTQIRMDIVSVTVTVEGDDREATVPGDKLRVVRPFDVEEGIVTVLTLDFDADKSVVITGNGAVQFKPVVKLMVWKESQEGRETPQRVPTSTPAPTITPTPTATPDPISGAFFLEIVSPVPDGDEAIAFVTRTEPHPDRTDADRRRRGGGRRLRRGRRGRALYDRTEP